jgi:hypothetical protein
MANEVGEFVAITVPTACPSVAGVVIENDALVTTGAEPVTGGGVVPPN